MEEMLQSLLAKLAVLPPCGWKTPKAHWWLKLFLEDLPTNRESSAVIL